MELKELESEVDVKTLISPEYAFENNVLPIKIVSKDFYVAIQNKNNIKLIKDLEFNTGYKIVPSELSGDVILQKLKELFPDSTSVDKKANNGESNKNGALYNQSNIDFVNQVITNALKMEASDIHFEVYEEQFRIRYRIDGYLREVLNLPYNKSLPVISRIKIMANLDIAEKRRPQDGKIKYQNGNNSVDIRVSSLPTTYGEKVVLRLLDKSTLNLNLNKLGFCGSQLDLFTRILKNPYGMILVTGPTGSGKTTTLYAALKYIHSVDRNILTIEDPVEYNLPGINQSNVKPDIGYDFSSALRAFLRQDPDIIMVGEIRDKETAEIAIRASLTGHLVLSTLHTNDSVSAITRLIDMGIEPYLVGAALKMVIAQRLVRNLCECKINDTKRTGDSFKISSEIFTKNGCEKCGYTGYKGRTALFEMFEVNEIIQNLISKGGTLNEIRAKVNETGFFTIRHSGIEKLKNGITSYEEIMRETVL
jgi:type IV pilus assembly protein PilB